MANFFSLDSLFDEAGNISGMPDGGNTASEKYVNGLRELFERWKSNKVVSDVMDGKMTFYQSFKDAYDLHLQSDDLDSCLGRIRTPADRAKAMKDAAIGAAYLSMFPAAMVGVSEDVPPRRNFLRVMATAALGMAAGASSMLLLGATNSNESILEYRAKSLDTMYSYIRK